MTKCDVEPEIRSWHGKKKKDNSGKTSDIQIKSVVELIAM